MKKLLFVLLSVMIVAGAWAQTMPIPVFPDPTIDLDQNTSFVESLFDGFDVVSAESVESRTSWGIFTSMVDDYIGVNTYDPETGTFVFLGGGNGLSNTTHISFGIGKTLSFGYLGIYYGGHLVRAEGVDTANDYDASDNTYSSYHNAQWDNNIAVLFGTSTIGAFRLDLNLSQSDRKSDDNGALTQAIADNDTNPSIALTWGGIELAGLAPYATIGILLPTTYSVGSRDIANNKNYSVDVISGGLFGIQAGVSHGSGLWGDLSLLFASDTTAKGETWDAGTVTKTDIVISPGAFGAGLRGGYTQTFEVGKLAFGFEPQLLIGFRSENRSWSDKIADTKSEAKENPTTTNFELMALVNLGAKFQINDKFALYTGTGLRILDWQVRSVATPGGIEYKDTATVTQWFFDGFNWLEGNLRFGLTITPIENLVIGFDATQLVGRFFNINPANMTAGTGFQNTGANNLGDFATYWIRGLTLNLTVSYRFSN
ncbi:MAG: hypothetical protein LBI28_14345 [Treponema sp.]|jgi:hypothetical protein|nr:hypothetical protein [Treponema sp.]